ncbi:hypothetical protein HYV10_02535 [Candidatus Dependentiae bacterium]|nr:hypothetical protein [Candidatus Dependentiae bacterium]
MKKLLGILSLSLYGSLIVASGIKNNKLGLLESIKFGDKRIPNGVTLHDAKEALCKELTSLNYSIELELLMKAGKPQMLYGKNVVIDLEHIINMYPVIKDDRTATLQGGHMHKVVAALTAKDQSSNAVIERDEKTNCWLFDGRDYIIGNRFYKTTFPQGWTPGDIYAAICSSSMIKTESVGDKLIVRALVKHKNNSEFILRTVLYRRPKSDIYEMLTAFPEL